MPREGTKNKKIINLTPRKGHEKKKKKIIIFLKKK